MSDPQSVPFRPAALRFRVWDGSRMRYPGDRDTDIEVGISGDFKVRGWDGQYWPELHGCALMQAVGSYDAEGKEVFDGDVIALRRSAAGPVVIGHVAYDKLEGAWTVTGDADVTPAFSFRTDIYYVVGNVYETEESSD